MFKILEKVLLKDLVLKKFPREFQNLQEKGISYFLITSIHRKRKKSY